MNTEQKRHLIWHVAIRNLQALAYDFERNIIEFDKHVIDLIWSLGAAQDYWN